MNQRPQTTPATLSVVLRRPLEPAWYDSALEGPAKDNTAPSGTAQTEEQPCRFLDSLPPELRVYVYDELLLYDDEQLGKILSSQILATCKFINQEAQQILETNYTNNLVARIKLSSEEEPTIRYGKSPSAQTLRKPERLSCELLNFHHLAPNYRRVIINLDMCSTNPNGFGFDQDWEISFYEYMTRVRFQLYMLVAQIQASPNVKELHLRIRMRGYISPGDAHDVLRKLLIPIRQLGSDVQLYVTGVHDSVISELRQAYPASGGDLGKTALWQWLQVKKETAGLIGLLERARIVNTGVRYLLVSQASTWEQLAADMDPRNVFVHSYVQVEKYLSQSAATASGQLRTGRWKRLRDWAEARLSAMP